MLQGSTIHTTVHCLYLPWVLLISGRHLWVPVTLQTYLMSQIDWKVNTLNCVLTWPLKQSKEKIVDMLYDDPLHPECSHSPASYGS